VYASAYYVLQSTLAVAELQGVVSFAMSEFSPFSYY